MRLYSALLEYFLVRCPLAIALNINHTLRESKQFRNSSEHQEQTKKNNSLQQTQKHQKHQVSHGKMTNVHHFVKIFEIRCPFLQSAARITSSMGLDEAVSRHVGQARPWCHQGRHQTQHSWKSFMLWKNRFSH